MQILKQDRKKGFIRLRVQNLDDLWHLEKILEPGDLLKARTFRKTTIKRGKEIIPGERKPLTLAIKVEKVGFHPETGKLRAGGEIQEGPEDVQKGAHHTIQIEPGLDLTVTKAWKRAHLERLKRAGVQEPLLYICMIDRDGADFAALRASGTRFLGSKRYRKVKGKEEREDFYQELGEHLEKQKGYKAMVLAGPGFERENLHNYLKKKMPGLAKRIVLEHANETGRTGVQEVIKKSANKVLAETRLARETRLVEKLLAEMGRDGMVVYGPGETRKAAETGAIETALVSDKTIPEFEPLLDLVEKTGGKVVVISSSHQAGESFLSLGGIAGFLRFKV